MLVLRAVLSLMTAPHSREEFAKYRFLGALDLELSLVCGYGSAGLDSACRSAGLCGCRLEVVVFVTESPKTFLSRKRNSNPHPTFNELKWSVRLIHAQRACRNEGCDCGPLLPLPPLRPACLASAPAAVFLARPTISLGFPPEDGARLGERCGLHGVASTSRSQPRTPRTPAT